MQRIRVRFGTDGPTRFIGHLDLALAWERMLRRAQVPIAYSQGYNPQPKMNLAAALPLGFTSECELVDVWLDQPLASAELVERLNAAAPPGITILHAEEVELKAKAPQAELTAIEYWVTVAPRPDLPERIAGLLAAEALPRRRRGKQYDLRSLIETIWLEDAAAGVLGMRLVALPGGTGRPDEVLDALGLDPLAAHIHRTRLFFRPPAG